MTHKARIFEETPNQAMACTLVDQMGGGQCHPLTIPEIPLVLYGKGNLGKMAQAYLQDVACSMVPMIERDEASDTNVCVAVSVVTSPYVPIETTLLSRGYKAVMPFYDL